MDIPVTVNTSLRKFVTLLRLPLADKWLFLQIYILLGLTRFAILTVPFAKMSVYYGQRMVESPPEANPEHLKTARKIGWAIRKMSAYTPWKSNCYPQALTAKYLLQRRGIQTTLYFGAAFKTSKEMEAHAWVRCGQLFVTGGPGHQSFGTCAYFS